MCAWRCTGSRADGRVESDERGPVPARCRGRAGAVGGRGLARSRPAHARVGTAAGSRCTRGRRAQAPRAHRRSRRAARCACSASSRSLLRPARAPAPICARASAAWRGALRARSGHAAEACSSPSSASSTPATDARAARSGTARRSRSGYRAARQRDRRERRAPARDCPRPRRWSGRSRLRRRACSSQLDPRPARCPHRSSTSASGARWSGKSMRTYDQPRAATPGPASRAGCGVPHRARRHHRHALGGRGLREEPVRESEGSP